MSETVGKFFMPQVRKTSDLINDTRFSSIHEYVLDGTSLSGSPALDISDLGAGSTIYRIELVVFSPLTAGNTTETIQVTGGNTILMASNWNNPMAKGTYVTDCYYSVGGTPGELTVNHSLAGYTSGMALLRLHVYNNVVDYTDLLTNSGAAYYTQDQRSVEVIDS